MMIFKRPVVAALAFALILLAGCSEPQQADNAKDIIPQYTLPPVIKEAVPAVGGALTFPVPKNPASLNPLKAKNVGLYNLLSLVYEAPIRIKTDGRPEPELVETWEVDESGLVWTFHVRPGVQWHHGHGEMTAADIVYTINQLKSYAASDSNYAYRNGSIANSVAIDRYTVRITQTQPGNAAVYYMTFPVLCRAYSESRNMDTAIPVGTGPYKVDTLNMMDKVELSAHADWWKQPPYIQALTGVCYPDHDTELAAFKQNLFDFVTTSTLTVDTYQKYGEIVYIDYLTQYYDCIVPNSSGLFSDTNLRLAVAYALDKRDIVSKALLGHAVVTDYPVVPDSHLSPGSSKIFEYNRQKAMELLEQSGWKDRNSDGVVERVEDGQITTLSFSLLVNKNETYRLDVAENVAAQLRECGMDVAVVAADAEDHAGRLRTGFFDLALCSFYLEINPDISALVGTGGDINYGRFSDEELDRLLKNCREALDEEAMKQAYAEMEDRYLQMMPQIGLYFRTNALLYKAKINTADGLRDRNLFATIPQWYLYVEGPQQ